jgi:hypothetical protein
MIPACDFVSWEKELANSFAFIRSVRSQGMLPTLPGEQPK